MIGVNWQGDIWCTLGTITDTGINDLMHPHWCTRAERYAPQINPETESVCCVPTGNIPFGGRGRLIELL